MPSPPSPVIINTCQHKQFLYMDSREQVWGFMLVWQALTDWAIVPDLHSSFCKTNAGNIWSKGNIESWLFPFHICSQCSLDSSLRIMICLLKIPSTNATRVCIFFCCCCCFKVLQKSLTRWLFDCFMTERQADSNTDNMAAVYGMTPVSITLGQHLTSCNATVCSHSSWSSPPLHPPDYQLAEPFK